MKMIKQQTKEFVNYLKLRIQQNMVENGPRQVQGDIIHHQVIQHNSINMDMPV